LILGDFKWGVHVLDYAIFEESVIVLDKGVSTVRNYVKDNVLGHLFALQLGVGWILNRETHAMSALSPGIYCIQDEISLCVRSG
jgi:hypothetical protein